MTTEQQSNLLHQTKAEPANHGLQADHQSDLISQHFGTGGGSLTSISDALQVNEFSGSSGFSFPITLSQARGVTPSLALNYASGTGHTAFGLGMNIQLPMISHRTSGVSIPQYNDEDVLIYSNGDYLVPALDSSNNKVERTETIDGTSYKVTAYRPRSQGEVNRIERLRNNTSGREDDTFWRVVTPDNQTMIFGYNDNGRLADPQNNKRIFSWLLQEVVDAKGNHQRVYYAAEDNNNGNTASDAAETGHTHVTNRYLARIQYGNRDNPSLTPYLFAADEPNVDWMFEVAFDYGQHNLELTNSTPDVVPSSRYWTIRQDPYSSYNSGFEVRTRRLCQNVLLFHSFPETQGGSAQKRLVKRWQFEHQQSKSATLLTAVTEMGMVYQSGNTAQPYRAEVMPPVELSYQQFNSTQGEFKSVALSSGSEQLQGLQQGRYQLADMFQEGIPSVVYRDSQWMYYRKPQRVERINGQYQLTYGPLQKMPELPAQGGKLSSYRLSNLTKQGKVELVATEPGKAGYFSCNSDGQWQSFIPFDAFPTEFNLEQAKFADITGEGAADLVMIGPNSVRFYTSQFTKGFAAGKEVTSLPDGFPTSLEGGGIASIGFSDLLGTGQAHLFRISHNKVEVWPNLGHGKFGAAIEMANPPQIAAEGFTPSALFLADLDGSGTSDIVYIDGKQAHVYLNQSGNSFADPFVVTLPESFDSVNQVSFADIYGIGSASLVLTVTHPEVQHLVYDFSQGNKAYLLNQVSNNKGYNLSIEYGSSAHDYLDDQQQNRPWRTPLPLAIQVVKQVSHRDEINDLTLGQTYQYSNGFYDYQEKEYRGFGRVEKREMEQAQGSNLTPSAPICVVNWYHTGEHTMDETYDDQGTMRISRRRYYYQFNRDIADISATLMEQNGLSGAQNTLDFQRNAHRALKGKLLRSEVYAIENNQCKADPYSAQEFRYRVKYIQSSVSGDAGLGVVQARTLENISYQYDEVADDPKIKHQLIRSFDDYGYSIDSIAVAYPRLATGTMYRQQGQQQLWISRTQNSYIHQTGNNIHLLGLPNQTEQHQLKGVSIPSSKAIFRVEDFTNAYFASASSELLHLSRQRYADAGSNQIQSTGQATAQALLSHTETAVLNKALLKTLLVDQDSVFANKAELETLLQQEGGFTTSNSDSYWWQTSERTEYATGADFYLPLRSIDVFNHSNSLTYDDNKLKVASVTNAVDNKVSCDWHYRTLNPLQITDWNANKKSMQYDGFGRVQRAAYRGTEQGVESGFTLLTGDASNSLSASSLLSDPVAQVGDFAQVEATADRAWMGQITSTALSAQSAISTSVAGQIITQLAAKKWITAEGYLRQAAWQTIHATDDFALPVDSDITQSQQAALRSVLRGIKRQPIHKVNISAQDYAQGRSGAAKVRSAVVYMDGFGRTLQQKAKVESGQAFNINAQGELQLSNGQPEKLDSSNRWLTSGRTVYNNKGQAIQQFEPYYLNTADFIEHEQLRKFGVSKTLSYDALGRVVQSTSAKGMLAKTEYSPWFQRHFDENDMLLSSPYYRVNVLGEGGTTSAYYDADLLAHRNASDAADSDVPKRRAVDEHLAIEQSKVLVDTPTTQIYDGLDQVIAKEKLDYAKVSADSFSDTGFNSSQLTALINHLKAEGIVTQANTLSSQFQSTLGDLPQALNGQKEQVQTALRNLHQARRQLSTQSYDILGRVLTMQDARISTPNVRHTYNLAFKVKTQSVDAGTTWTITNAVGKPVHQKDSTNLVLKFEYDALHRRTQVQEEVDNNFQVREMFEFVNTAGLSSSEKTAAQEQNLIGQLKYVYDQSGRTEFTKVNLSGLLLEQKTRFATSFKTAVSWPATEAARVAMLEAQEYQQSSTYNARGEVLTETDAESGVKRYAYYASGQLSGVKHQRDGGNEQTLVSQIQYAANGQVTSEVHSGVLSQYSYERTTLKLQRSVSTRQSDNQVLRDQRYTYDPVGNVLTIREASALSNFSHSGSVKPVQSYEYDALYRLIQAKGRKQAGNYSEQDLPQALSLSSSNPHAMQSYTQKFSYDMGNNMTRRRLMADVNNTQDFTVDTQSNRSILASGNGNFADLFDATGNLLSITGNSNQEDLSWNYNGNLVKALLVDRSGSRDDAEYYVYNASGDRVRKVAERYASDLNQVNVEEVRYLGDLEIRSKGQRQATENHSQVNNTEVLVVSKLAAGNASDTRLLSWKTGLPGGQLNHEYRTTLANHQNSANIEITSQGELISFEEYYAFGGTAVQATRNQTEVSLKHYRYSGKERDNATGLYYYGMRYYAPWQCRWLSPDPAGLVDGFNLYAFVQNNPVTYKDPNGLNTEDEEERETQEERISFEDSDDATEPEAQSSGSGTSGRGLRVEATVAEEESALEKATNLIRDLVSLRLNVDADNALETKGKVLEKYAELKELADSKAFTPKELGGAFNKVADEIDKAGQAAKGSFDLKTKGAAGANRKKFAEAFDQQRAERNAGSVSEGSNIAVFTLNVTSNDGSGETTSSSNEQTPITLPESGNNLQRTTSIGAASSSRPVLSRTSSSPGALSAEIVTNDISDGSLAAIATESPVNDTDVPNSAVESSSSSLNTPVNTGGVQSLVSSIQQRINSGDKFVPKPRPLF